MRNFLLLFFLFLLSVVFSQNQLSVYTHDGSLIRLYLGDSLVNKEAQASIQVKNIKKDTVQIRVTDDTGLDLTHKVYLLDKGAHCSNLEFNYVVNKKAKSKISFDGIEEIPVMPARLVPDKPAVDTSMKYRNRGLGHYADMKEGKPSYFNNIPKDGECIDPMPEIYLSYMKNLMQKAHTDDDRYLIAENTTRYNCINVSQLNRILTYVPFEIEKLKLIKSSYYHITDKKDCKYLDSTFRLEASKTELMIFLKTADANKINTVSTCTVSSKDNDIKKLGIMLDATSNDIERMATFRKVYDQYCYNLSHARSIISLFVHDKERLDAAKLIYFHCMEKKNFLSLSDIFSYKGTEAELEDFLKKQN